MNERKWAVTVTFQTPDGVTVTRALQPIRDPFRSNAVARAIGTGIPPTAKVITATAKAVR